MKLTITEKPDKTKVFTFEVPVPERFYFHPTVKERLEQASEGTMNRKLKAAISELAFIVTELAIDYDAAEGSE